jgi:hypothetical protein
MSTFIIVFAATEGQVSRDNALRLADLSTDILRHLALSGTNWPEACIIAVQNFVARLRRLNPELNCCTRSSIWTAGILSLVGCHWVYQQHVRYDDSMNLRYIGFRRSGTATSRTATVMATVPPSGLNNHTLYPPISYAGGINVFTMPGSAMQNMNVSDAINPGSAYLAGAGNFLGIAQQSSDNPIPNDEIMHLFNGEVMAHWLGGDFGFGGSMTYQDESFQ